MLQLVLWVLLLASEQLYINLCQVHSLLEHDDTWAYQMADVVALLFLKQYCDSSIVNSEGNL